MNERGQLLAAAVCAGAVLAACTRDLGPAPGQPGVAAPVAEPTAQLALRPSARPTASPTGRAQSEAQAAELRSQIEQLGSGPTSEEQEQQADVQRQEQAEQALISSLGSRLQAGDADLNARRQILAFQDQQQQQLLQQQLQQVSSSLQAKQQLLASRERQLSQALWPTGATYDDLNVLALQDEVARLRDETSALQSTYDDLTARSQAAVSASVADQEALLNGWQSERSALEAELAQAKASLEALKTQSQQISSAVSERQARAEQLKSELKQLGG